MRKSMRRYSLLLLLASACWLLGCNNAHEIQINNSGGSVPGPAERPQVTTEQPATQHALELKHDQGTEMTTSAGGTVSSGSPAERVPGQGAGSAPNAKGAGIAGEQNAQLKNDIIPPAKDDETRPHH